MRYGEIARKIREESKIMESSAARLNALADQLDRIENATPKVDRVVERPVEFEQGKMLLSVKEASEALGISRPIVHQLTHRDDFPSIRIGRRVLINAKKLQEWLDNQSEVWVD